MQVSAMTLAGASEFIAQAGAARMRGFEWEMDSIMPRLYLTTRMLKQRGSPFQPEN